MEPGIKIFDQLSTQLNSTQLQLNWVKSSHDYWFVPPHPTPPPPPHPSQTFKALQSNLWKNEDHFVSTTLWVDQESEEKKFKMAAKKFKMATKKFKMATQNFQNEF